MAECPAEPTLEHFLSGRLDDAVQGAVARHVDGCPACQATLTRLGEDEHVSKWRRLGRQLPIAGHSAVLAEQPAGGLLRDRGLDSTAPSQPGGGPERDRPVVAGYELLAELGRGGMGVVYQARQLSLNRVVALKVVRAGAHADGPARARFRTEAEAVARIRHPHIVQIHEVGEQDGCDFYVMEWVEGGSLARRLDGTPWPARRAAALVEQLARAVQAAHQRDVVHRDLKPANVLLTADGEPKIADFGLARRLDRDERQTQTGAVVGTPSYMPPEQAAGGPDAVSPRSDIYSLGAVLYELLAGRPPFKGPTPLDTLFQVRFDEPVSPCRLVPQLAADLETICLKCLKKEPRERYPTASALADDLRRFLDGRPITARPAGVVERLTKWVRRRPAHAALLAACTVALLALTAFVVGQSYQSRLEAKTAEAERERDAAHRANDELDRQKREVERQKDRVEEQRRLVQRVLFAADVDRAGRAWDQGDVVRARRLLLRQRPERTGGTNLRGFGYHYLWRQVNAARLTVPAHSNHAAVVAFRPDGRALLSGGADGLVKWWCPETGRLTGSFPAHEARLFTAAFSPDGKFLATGSEANHAKVWDLATGKVVHDLGHPNALLGVAFSPDGRLLATATREGTVHLWGLATGKELLNEKAHALAAAGVAFHPDGKHFATTGPDGVLRIWDSQSRRPVHSFEGKDGVCGCVAYSPDGKCLAVAGNGGIEIWDRGAAGNYRERPVTFAARGFVGAGVFESYRPPTTCIGFSPDGRRLASGSQTGQVLVWDVRTGQPLFSQQAHSGAVLSVAFRPDGKEVASAGEDGYVRFWSHANPPQHEWALVGHRFIVSGVAFHPTDRRVASAGTDGTIRLWDAETGRGQVFHAGPANDFQFRDVAFDPEGKRLAWAGAYLRNRPRREAMVMLRDVAGNDPLLIFHGHSMPVSGIAFSPDGTRLATAGEDTTVKVWDSQTGRVLLTLEGHAGPVQRVAFHPDGEWIASASSDKTARVWDSRTGRELLTLGGHDFWVNDVAFSPDGARLATAGQDGVIKFWDVATGRELLALEGQHEVASVAFSPDGRRLASGGSSGVKLWDSATGQEVLTLPAPRAMVLDVAFSRDGQRLAAGLTDGTVKVWDCGHPFPEAETAEPGPF